MGVGVFLLILGSILAFAVRGDTSAVDLQTAGLIFIIGGAAIIHHTRKGSKRVKETTVVEDRDDPDKPVRTVRESVEATDPYGNVPENL